jgi:Flp pilus assembly protein TadG
MGLRARARERAQMNDNDENGFVILWLVIVLVLLLSIAAFAVDLVHAYQEAEHLQNAVDAASLAGAIELPHALDDSAAKARARELMLQNGFPVDGSDPNNTVMTLGQTGPNEVTVDVKHTFGTFFARIIGFDALTVRRKGIAQYDAPVAMGSATNNLGDIPSCPPTVPPSDPNPFDLVPECVTGSTPAEKTSNGHQRLWASIQGRDGFKHQGNAYTTHNCTADTDGCNGSGVNTDENVNGEFFRVRNDVGGPLSIWVYDPGFVHTTPSCGAAPFFAGVAGAWNDGDPEHIERFTRYTDARYCPGDTSFTGGINNPVTTFTVYGPEAVPDSNPLNNPVVCSTKTFNGYASPDSAHAAGPADATYQGWHAWYDLCTFSGIATNTDNEYIVQVNTPSGIGVNNFSLLALHGNVPSPQLNIFSKERLPLTAVDFTNSSSSFYLSRILPSTRDRELEVEFFDLGDSSLPGASSAGTLTIETQGVSGGFIPVCEYTPPPPTGTGSPYTPPPPVSGCTVSYDASTSAASTWNGRSVKFRIRLPASSAPGGYNCGPTNIFANCWLKLRVTPNAGSGMSDATTWTAKMVGSPVRLVG